MSINISTEQPQTTSRTLLKIGQVVSMTGLSRASIYRLVKSGEFPQSVKLSVRAVAWVSSEVSEWINNTIQSSRGETVEGSQQ